MGFFFQNKRNTEVMMKICCWFGILYQHVSMCNAI